ncbi:hypothetical protein J7L67_01810 [bacterium]|nr:hypothetical protein [bacterium]
MSLFTQKYKVTAYSPIHIGSMKKWLKDVHFEQSNDSTNIHNINISDIPFDDTQTEFNLEEAGKFILNSLKSDETLHLKFPAKIFAHEISQFAKTAWGTPYIPGNSINGFYHSAKLLNQPDKSSLMNTVGVPDYSGLSDKDGFKIFIEDIEFPMNSIDISDIKMLNLTSKQSYGWKKYWPKPTTIQNPLTATSQYIETLKAGEASLSTIKIQSASNTNLDSNELFNYFETITKEFSRKIAKNELDFYSKCKMDEGYNFYWTLNEKIKKISNGFYVCLGWGIGWQALVGNLHTDKNIPTIMRKYNLGKLSRPCPECKTNLKIDKFNKNKLFCLKCKKSFGIQSVATQIFPVFPKTRKFVFDRQKPLHPLGWIRFERSENFKKIRNPQTHDVEIIIQLKKSKIIKDPFRNPEAYPEKKSETKHFKKKIKIAGRGSFPTEFNMFFNKIAELEFIISINGNSIDDNLDTTRFIHNDKIDELIFNFSLEARGIELLIKTGAVNSEQKNFVINRIWEILEEFQKKDKDKDNE